MRARACVCVCVCETVAVWCSTGWRRWRGNTHSHRCIPLGLATMVFKRRWPAAVHVHLPRGIYLSTRPPTPCRACPWIAERTEHRTPETCIIIIILLLLCSHDESKTTTTAAAADYRIAVAADFGCIISILNYVYPTPFTPSYQTFILHTPVPRFIFYGNCFHQIF